MANLLGDTDQVRWRVLVIAILVCFCTGMQTVVLASQQTTATISGVVTDSSSGYVVGATVRVKSLDTSEERVVKSDSEGRYLVPQLKVGKYSVVAEGEGFQAVKRDIDLSVGEEAVIILVAKGDFFLPQTRIGERLCLKPTSSQISRSSTR